MITATRLRRSREPGTLDVPVLLARQRSRELALAHTFKECHGASTAEIEDILDNTITVLLTRPYTSEERLFAALRKGIKMRALRLHRDRRARERILAHTAPVIYASERDRASKDDPEQVLIAREDDLIISEFLADLTKQEREAFVLHAEGRSWRAIATALKLPESKGLALTRACERKRERFVALYLAGRLCGYRSRTISSLIDGALTDTDLALEQALAHLSHCRSCQAEHDTSAEELRGAFDRRALALLPPPLLASAPTNILDHARALLERTAGTLARFTHTRTPSTTERVTETIAGASAATKVAAGVVSVAVLAGSTIGATHLLGPHRNPHPRSLSPSSSSVLAGAQEPAATPVALSGLAPRTLTPTHDHGDGDTSRYGSPEFGPGHSIPYQPDRGTHPGSRQHEPPGFAYLGVPTSDIPARYARPSSLAAATTTRAKLANTPIRGHGGPFTP